MPVECTAYTKRPSAAVSRVATASHRRSSITPLFALIAEVMVAGYDAPVLPSIRFLLSMYFRNGEDTRRPSSDHRHHRARRRWNLVPRPAVREPAAARRHA